MKKKLHAVAQPEPRLLAEWRLPISNKPIRLEVVRNKDGFDSPTLNVNAVGAYKLHLDKYAIEYNHGVDEEDQRFFQDTIVPQAQEVIQAYYLHRAKEGFPTQGRGRARQGRKATNKRGTHE